MKVLNYKQAHAYADRNKHFVSWEGWDLVLFRPTPVGYSKPQGMFKDGKWGMATRVSPDAAGNWVIR